MVCLMWRVQDSGPLPVTRDQSPSSVQHMAPQEGHVSASATVGSEAGAELLPVEPEGTCTNPWEERLLLAQPASHVHTRACARLTESGFHQVGVADPGSPTL